MGQNSRVKVWYLALVKRLQNQPAWGFWEGKLIRKSHVQIAHSPNSHMLITSKYTGSKNKQTHRRLFYYNLSDQTLPLNSN